MDIGYVLTRAWQIIWKHKVLWIFGILAGCTGNGGGGNNFRTSFQGETPQQYQQFIRPFENMPQWEVALLIGLAILVILVLVVLSIFLSTVGRIGLIRGTQQVEGGTTSVIFGELFSGSMPYFWRVFGLGLLVGLLVLVVGAIFAVLAVAGVAVTLGLGLLCLIPLLCVLVPVIWFVTVIVEQASIAIVVENLGIMDGLRRGWEVVRANLGTMIIMALILVLGVGTIGGIIISLPILLIVVPAVIAVASANNLQAPGFGLVLAGLCFIAYLPVYLVLNGILRSYIESAWTLTFMRLTSKPAALEPSNPPSEALSPDSGSVSP